MPALQYQQSLANDYLKKYLEVILKNQNNPHELVRKIQMLIAESDHNTFLRDMDKKSLLMAIKEELTHFLAGKSILTELVFKEMWWHKNPLMRQLSTYLIPLFTTDSDEILPYLRKLDNRGLTELVANRLVFLHQKNKSKFILFLNVLSRQGNKHQRLLSEYLIQFTFAKNSSLEESVRPILSLLAADTDMEVRSFAREIGLKYFRNMNKT